MLFEYAIDPKLFSDLGNCQKIFDNFRSERGKVVANVPRTWHRDAVNALTGKPVMRKTLKRYLEKLVRESLCRSRPATDWDRVNQSWLQHVSEANDLYPFAAVLAEEYVEDPIVTYALSRLLFECPECWNEPTEMPVARNAHDIVNALMPLFRLSRQITLIDMHLYPNDPYSRRVLIELLRRIPEFNFGRGVAKITVNSSDHRHDLQDSLNQYLLRHLPEDFELEYRLWPKSIEHDRFAVTEVGGVFLGHGFDESKSDGPQEVFMSLIGHDTRRSLLAKFSANPTYRALIK